MLFDYFGSTKNCAAYQYRCIRIPCLSHVLPGPEGIGPERDTADFPPALHALSILQLQRKQSVMCVSCALALLSQPSIPAEVLWLPKQAPDAVWVRAGGGRPECNHGNTCHVCPHPQAQSLRSVLLPAFSRESQQNTLPLICMRNQRRKAHVRSTIAETQRQKDS